MPDDEGDEYGVGKVDGIRADNNGMHVALEHCQQIVDGGEKYRTQNHPTPYKLLMLQVGVVVGQKTMVGLRCPDVPDDESDQFSQVQTIQHPNPP